MTTEQANQLKYIYNKISEVNLGNSGMSNLYYEINNTTKKTEFVIGFKPKIIVFSRAGAASGNACVGFIYDESSLLHNIYIINIMQLIL